MSYLKRIDTCNNFESADYRALLINDKVYGQVQPAFAEHLANWADIFTVTATQVVLNPALADYAARTAAVAPVLRPTV